MIATSLINRINKNSLFLHSFRYIFAAGFTKLSTFILSFAIIKLLTPNQYGEISILLVYYGLFTTILTLSMERAMPRYFIEKNVSEKNISRRRIRQRNDGKINSKSKRTWL